MTGIERGIVKLYDHDPDWKNVADETIYRLKMIFGDIAEDIQHIGSTAVNNIIARPIIDIAVAVRNFNDVFTLFPTLEKNGFIHKTKQDNDFKLFLFSGEIEKDIENIYIYIVKSNSAEWTGFINFRNYLNTFQDKAKEYEKLKINLAKLYPYDQISYLNGKEKFISYILRKALTWSYLGKTVKILIDRPIGHIHKKEKYSLTYPINYGYIPGVIGGDGEELDVYVLGEDKPLENFTGKIIGVINRQNDVEDKLIAAAENRVFDQAEIAEAVYFQEKYYKTTVDSIYRRSCGAIIYRKFGNKIKYLLIQQKGSHAWCFPKGHMEIFETEEQTALREIYEEVGIKANFSNEFKEEISYRLFGTICKTVVFFLSETNRNPKIRESEISDYLWLDAEEAKRLLYPEYGNLIDKAEKIVKAAFNV